MRGQGLGRELDKCAVHLILFPSLMEYEILLCLFSSAQKVRYLKYFG